MTQSSTIAQNRFVDEDDTSIADAPARPRIAQRSDVPAPGNKQEAPSEPLPEPIARREAPAPADAPPASTTQRQGGRNTLRAFLMLLGSAGV